MGHFEKKLLSISSAALAEKPRAMPALVKQYALGPELFNVLLQKNGFYVFESALHVFPITQDPSDGLEGWNSLSLWRHEYKDLGEGFLFFGEDIFQDQFCLSLKQDGVFRFIAETGESEFLANSLEKWAERILADYKVETGWPLAYEWQRKYGPLQSKQRLMPKIPFVLGGKYDIDNLWAGDALEGMRFKASIALQIKHLPDGSSIRLNVAKPPQ
jgi:hypothetical protein